jgi:hypothetical protein
LTKRQLRLEDNLPAILKGKQIVKVEMKHQMPLHQIILVSKSFDGSVDDEDDLKKKPLLLIKIITLNSESLLCFCYRELNLSKKTLPSLIVPDTSILIDFPPCVFTARD